MVGMIFLKLFNEWDTADGVWVLQTCTKSTNF